MEVLADSEACRPRASDLAFLTCSSIIAVQQLIPFGIKYKPLVGISHGASSANLSPAGITATLTTLVVSASDNGLCELTHIQLMAV